MSKHVSPSQSPSHVSAPDFCEHLSLEPPSLFKLPVLAPVLTSPILTPCLLPTNFGFSVANDYVFLLLHLRNESGKNRLGISIPDTAIFHNREVYDIVESRDGHIRSRRVEKSERLKTNSMNSDNRVQKTEKNHQTPLSFKLAEVFFHFKKKWKTASTIQHCEACFTRKQTTRSTSIIKKKHKLLSKTTEQHVYPSGEITQAICSNSQFDYLLLSETDFLGQCKKNRNDSFFSQLCYIKNKLPPILRHELHDFTAAEWDTHLKSATQSLVGTFNPDPILRDSLSHDAFLGYLCTKVCLFLNFMQNIRVLSGQFSFGLATNGSFYLTNTKKLVVINLTPALKVRQLRLQHEQEQRNSKLILTAEKQQLLQQFRNGPSVGAYEHVMGRVFDDVVSSYRIKTNSSIDDDNSLSTQVMKKIRGDDDVVLSELIKCSDFRCRLDKIYSKRKPLTKPSLFVQKIYDSTAFTDTPTSSDRKPGLTYQELENYNDSHPNHSRIRVVSLGPRGRYDSQTEKAGQKTDEVCASSNKVIKSGRKLDFVRTKRIFTEGN